MHVFGKKSGSSRVRSKREVKYSLSPYWSAIDIRMVVFPGCLHTLHDFTSNRVHESVIPVAPQINGLPTGRLNLETTLKCTPAEITMLVLLSYCTRSVVRSIFFTPTTDSRSCWRHLRTTITPKLVLIDN